MEKTSKPTVAGILAIISGVLGLIGAISMFIGFGVVSGALGIPTGYIPGCFNDKSEIIRLSLNEMKSLAKLD